MFSLAKIHFVTPPEHWWVSVFYLILFSVLIYRFRIFRYFKLSAAMATGLFLLKVAIGFAYYYIHRHYYRGGDTYSYMAEATYIYDSIFISHSHFLTLMLYPNGNYFPPSINLYVQAGSYWADRGTFQLIRMIALFQIFTCKGFWASIVWFNFTTMIGQLALYKTFSKLFPEKKLMILIAIFLVPETLFWTSGIHKDGVILCFMGLLFMCAADFLAKKLNWLKVIIGLFSSLVLISLRGYDFWLMLPGFFALLLIRRFKVNSFLSFVISYTAFITSILLINAALPDLYIFDTLVTKQKQFDIIKSVTALKPLPINYESWSYIKAFPMAFVRGFFLPNIFSYNSWHELIYACLHTAFLLTTFCLLVFGRIRIQRISSLAWFCLFYSLSMLTFIGLIVCNSGALVRYSASSWMFFALFVVLASRRYSFKQADRWLEDAH